jgi:hypothetical protein
MTEEVPILLWDSRDTISDQHKVLRKTRIRRNSRALLKPSRRLRVLIKP